MDESKPGNPDQPEQPKQRETITLFVSGNASDAANVQAVLAELASLDDAAIEEAQRSIEDMLHLLDEAGEEPDDAYEALEKVAELLSEIRLYNKVQKMDPMTPSTRLSSPDSWEYRPRDGDTRSK